jgi:hypothetical protein
MGSGIHKSLLFNVHSTEVDTMDNNININTFEVKVFKSK